MRAYYKLEIINLVASHSICMRLTAVINDLKCFKVGYCNKLSFVSVTIHNERASVSLLSNLLTIYSTTLNQ